MSKKEELEKSSNAYKSALLNQVDNLKGDVEKIGKSALWIGGGLLATYFVVDALTAKRKKKKNKGKKEVVEEVQELKPATDNLLMSTVKEQAIVFLLGMATQQLTKFLSELNSEDGEAHSGED